MLLFRVFTKMPNLLMKICFSFNFRLFEDDKRNKVILELEFNWGQYTADVGQLIQCIPQFTYERGRTDNGPFSSVVIRGMC